jgi:quinol monooxygenase YgiN
VVLRAVQVDRSGQIIHDRCRPAFGEAQATVRKEWNMWAQLIKVRLKPGKDMAQAAAQLRAAEQPGSGLVRETVMRDQKDPAQAYILAVFESEEKAREREQDPRRQEGQQAVQATMADILAGPPEFTDLTVDEEWTG